MKATSIFMRGWDEPVVIQSEDAEIRFNAKNDLKDIVFTDAQDRGVPISIPFIRMEDVLMVVTADVEDE